MRAARSTTLSSSFRDKLRQDYWSAPGITRLAGFFVVTFLAAWGSVKLPLFTNSIAVVWPADAILLVFILRAPLSHWPAYFCAAIAAYAGANLSVCDPLSISIALPCCNMLGILGMALPLRWRWGLMTDLKDTRLLREFMFLTVTLGPAISATGAVAVLWNGHNGVAIWLNWYLSVVTGFIIIAPLSSGISHAEVTKLINRKTLGKTISSFAVLIVLLAAVFLQERFHLLFLVLPGLLFVIFRLGYTAGLIACLVTAFVAAASTGYGHGGIVLEAGNNPQIRVIFLQLFLTIDFLTILVIGAALSQHDRLVTDLHEAQITAQAANKAKSVFLASMSHDLHTPLNAVIGFSEFLLLGREPLSARQRDYVDCILQSGRHLLALVRDILDFASLETGRIAYNIQPIGIADILGELFRTTEPLARNKGLRMAVSPPEPSAPMILADRVRLTQILHNFSSNAIKYNRPSGTIDVSVLKTDDHFMRLIVADSGIGIPAHRQRDVFTPFSRLGAETNNIEGTGIGLTICERLVAGMNGRIGFHSEEGHGSQFWVDLPLAPGSREEDLPRLPADPKAK